MPIGYALLALILGVFFGLIGTCPLAALAIIILFFAFKSIGDYRSSAKSYAISKTFTTFKMKTFATGKISPRS
jgi:hypothetical protein